MKIEITLFPRSFPFCKERPFFFIFYSFGENMFFSGKPNTKGSLFFFWTFDLIIIIIFNNTYMCNTNTSWYTLHSVDIYSHNMYYSHLYVASFQMWTEKKKENMYMTNLQILAKFHVSKHFQYFLSPSLSFISFFFLLILTHSPSDVLLFILFCLNKSR